MTVGHLGEKGRFIHPVMAMDIHASFGMADVIIVWSTVQSGSKQWINRVDTTLKIMEH